MILSLLIECDYLIYLNDCNSNERKQQEKESIEIDYDDDERETFFSTKIPNIFFFRNLIKNTCV